MDNFERSNRALEALQSTGHYEDIEDTLDIVLPTPDGEHERVAVLDGYPISDMMCDLMHLAARFGIDPMDKINEAIGHYGSELIEQAWEHSDDWDDTLQSQGNIIRATEILNINHVPIEHHDGIFIKVGLLPLRGDD